MLTTDQHCEVFQFKTFLSCPSRFWSIQTIVLTYKLVSHHITLDPPLPRAPPRNGWIREKEFVQKVWSKRRRLVRMEINEAATLKVRELPAGADRKGICRREGAKKSQFDHTSAIVIASLSSLYLYLFSLSLSFCDFLCLWRAKTDVPYWYQHFCSIIFATDIIFSEVFLSPFKAHWLVGKFLNESLSAQ